jgi:cytoskeletal protein RodZ
MDEYDDLYPDFGEEEEETEAGVVEAEESSNRTFLVGAIILGAVFVLGIAVVAILMILGRGKEPEVSANELTNQAVEQLFSATETAQYLTQSAPTVIPPTETPIPPTLTPTTMIEVSPEEEALEEGEEGEGEGGPLAPTPLEGEDIEAEPPSGLIEVTPLGGESEDEGEAAVEAEGIGGPISPSDGSTLPDTGFTGGAGLLGAGLLALVLAVAVVFARRMRQS